MNSIEQWILNRTINKKLKLMKPGIKLKLTGLVSSIAAIIGAASLLLDGNPSTNPDWSAVIAAVTAGIGLLLARQNNVSSEDVGLEK